MANFNKTRSVPFKSLDINVPNEILGNTLLYQHNFEKKTTEKEMRMDPFDIRLFKIHVNNIFRLYYIKKENDKNTKIDMVAKLTYKNRDYYVDMTAMIINDIGDDDDNSYCGTIFITKDVNVFMKRIIHI